MSSETYWAIRRRQRAAAEAPIAKTKPVEAPVVLTEADSLADLAGEPRPDNPTVDETYTYYSPATETVTYDDLPAEEEPAKPKRGRPKKVATE
jgi:hypothetical protein